MKIAFDLDGVLYDWHGAVWNKYFKSEYRDYEEFWKNQWDLVDMERWQAIMLDPDVYTKPANAEVVNMLHKLSLRYFIYYITLRPKDLTRVTQVWLNRNGFPDSSHLFIEQKSKVSICQKLEIDVVVEDRINMMDELCDNGIRVLGVRQPWNELRIDEFEHVDKIRDVERELARIEMTRKAHRRRNGNQ